MALTAETLGKRVREAIDRTGRKRQDIAAVIGVDPAALSRGLRGQRSFSTLEIARLCETLKISPMRLLGDGEAPPDPSAASVDRVRWMAELSSLLTELGYPVRRDHGYPATLLDRAVKAWLAGHISIRPIAGLAGKDADDLLEEVRTA